MITDRLYRFGLVGFPLNVSDSPLLFQHFFKRDQYSNCRYELFPLEHPEKLKEQINAIPSLIGFNVTIPHKENCFALCDHWSHEALATKAVNTVIIKNGQWTGHNADVHGFRQSLLSFIPKKPLRALVLGTGGASKSVAFVLRSLEIPFQLVSRQVRDDALPYQALNEKLIKQHPLIINTTPLGMKPHVHTFPDIPYSALSSEHYLYDLVYKPVITAFLARGIKSGSHVKNGLQMLSLQAEKAWSLWKPLAD